MIPVEIVLGLALIFFFYTLYKCSCQEEGFGARAHDGSYILPYPVYYPHAPYHFRRRWRRPYILL